MEQICGYVERLTFHNSENGYTVAQLQQPKQSELTCIVGCMPGIQPGETIRCNGNWKTHLIHGRQFEISSFRVEAPADILGIKKYLGSGLIKGIGPKYATRIVDIFGIDTLKIIEESPQRLLEIEGLGAKRVEKIQACWIEQKSIRDVMIFLQGHGVSPAFAQKIFKKYGSQSILKLKDNPYCLARDIFGVGFKTADTVAQKMGISKDSEQRIGAGIEYVLSQLSGDGHVCYPVDEFLKEAESYLEVKADLIEKRLEGLQSEERIILAQLIHEGKKRDFIWIKPLFIAETGIARELKRLKNGVSTFRSVNKEKAVEWVQAQLKIELAPNQKEAVAKAISTKLHIITGGPGTGKSTITNAILQITAILTQKILLAAPTGRAAKRMSEITKRKASTIHSLLEYDFKSTGGFKRNRENPLDCDLIIIDEASMIDTFLMYSLLKALPDHTRVIFVGDIHQLPSVGPGNVLNDMITSLTISVTTLKEIFRQAAGSHIITNAHRVNKGMFPSLYNGQNSDFFFIECQENEEVLNTILKLVSQRLPNRYGFNPHQDIQVLAPMKKGLIGTEHLNQSLQMILNPKEHALFRGGQKFQVGDKVMQIRNDYQKEVFNGDIGYILNIDSEEQQVLIQFEDKAVVYDYTDLDELILAYAISIHKFQGSECPCVVMPVHTSHFMLLHRNLLYTGITRGKKLVVLVGTKKALAIAVKKDDVQKRYTSLQNALMEII
ncbi:ATP-dependent RecD-like DNA helicase [Candidatus Protochlamydia amoebophila]|uniref:SF1B family DNA helicase RecD2 n=1 Tax=Candidatus Protochlamydia amoebophila TaxID=362787 RepID=UPI001BCA3ED5|nr:ATP-dependent RecD-like DNA helicase [Candidatus Protochlamydia amoebophila]MBS4163981.1 ATP-dependent RecD-like DNA helicase [Candidatus Protochlamydia amoebophila]